MDEKRQKEAERRAQMDDFWDIDALLPKKKPMPYVSDTSATEIVLDAKEESAAPSAQSIPPRKDTPSQSGEPQRRFIPPHTEEEILRAPKPEMEYEPEHVLLHKVRVFRWKSDYRYYEQFYRDAVKLYPIRGEECPRVPFFSYVPQYSQLTHPQLEWYLWWRQQFRQGVILDTDYSYLLLYAYELINLSHNLDPLHVREALCRLWVEYRKTFYQLDTYLPEWICDMSLLYRLPPPAFEDARLQTALLSHCTLKEFYVCDQGDSGYLRALLMFCSNYDYRKSKFYTGESTTLFDRAIFGTLKTVWKKTEQSGKAFAAANLEDSRMMRDSFTGALCSERIRKRIEVEYCSFSRSHELRFLITDIVKYTENQVRASLGIRSRLSIYALPMPIRMIIDAYLSEILPAARKHSPKNEEVSAAYERLYDAPRTSLSFEAAAQIERLSWDTTERLIEAFEDTETHGEEDTVPRTESEIFPPTEEKNASVANNTPKIEETEKTLSPFSPYMAFLRAVLAQDADAQRQAAKNAHKLLEVMADEVNALAADEMGDILLEEDGAGYCVIEDYREWLTDHLSQA